MSNTQELPSDVYAERMVLGSLLLRGDRWSEFADSLTSEDFSVDSHRIIWRRMGDLSRRGDPLDMVTLAGELNRRGEFEALGAKLVWLTDGVPEVPNLPSYVRLLREAGIRRRLVMEAARLQKLAADPTLELDALAETISRIGRECTLDTSDQEFASIAEIVDANGGLDAYCERRQCAAIPFPWEKLNEHTGGMRPGELIIIAGESGGGKTAFLGNILQHAATKGFGAALFSLEMSREQVCDRQLALAGRFNSRVFRQSNLHTTQIEKIETATGVLLDASLWIADSVNLTVQKFIGSIERLRAKRPVDVAAVDYLQLMSGSGQSDVERIGGIVRGLKNAAASLKIPVIGLSQFAKATQGSQRSADDLRGSSEIKHAANLALLLAGEQKYHAIPHELLEWKVRIDKQRDGESKLEMDLLWRKDCGLFVEAIESPEGEGDTITAVA